MLVLLFTAILALDKFGVQVTALVAGISVAGVAAGFAVQGILANLAAGLSIMLSRHFRIGDYIEIGTVKGQVQSIDLTMTILRTLEDARVIVPNRKIVGEIIYNYTGERRVTLTVQVGYNEDLERAYLRKRRESIDPNHASSSDKINPGHPKGSEGTETTHFNVVDNEGNAVAVTYTLNGGYGSGVTAPGLGFLLNNEMDDFASKPGEPNIKHAPPQRRRRSIPCSPRPACCGQLRPPWVEQPAGHPPL